MPEPLDAHERRELCDLFGDLGPEAPTCCEGWTTMDLAAHLVVRERKPQAALGILGGERFQGLLERATAKVLATGYPAIVEQVRNGPPIGPFTVPGLRSIINLTEYAVHHEDVRRANGQGPRTDRADLQDALWGLLRRSAGLQLRSVRKSLTVRLAPPGREPVSVGTGPSVEVAGEPVELALRLMGRNGVAQVELSGDPTAVAAFEAAALGI